MPAIPLFAATGSSPQGKVKQVLIRMKPGVNPRAMEPVHRRAGGKPVSSVRKLGVIRVNLETGDIDRAIQAYTSSGLVEYAEPNYIRRAAALQPNDPYYSSQWGLKKLGMEEAWEAAGSNLSPVVVAVLDTGVDLNHEDLKGVFATDPLNPGKVLGKRFYTSLAGEQLSDDDIQDKAGHGTHIAGIIAAATNNKLGVAGIASGAKIMPVKVLDSVGRGDDASIAEGVVWAADNGARVINMSLGGPGSSITLANAAKYARDKGVIVVAAAGNEGASTLSFPAAYDGVIAVGATNDMDNLWPQSNFGSYIDVVAPGLSIFSTYPSSKTYDGRPYEAHSGTSMAAGFVSGLAALLFSINPGSSADRIEGVLLTTADDLGETGWDRYYGHGRINASRAVAPAVDTVSPTVSVVAPVSGVQISDSTLTVSAVASDAGSGIAFVDLFLNGKRIGSDTSTPYEASVSLSELSGSNMVKVVAYDKSGNLGRAEVVCYKPSFTDVDPAYWAFEDIELLTVEKVIAGYPNGTFRPTGSVGRAEFTKMLIESMGLNKKSDYRGYFKDVKVTHWAWPYIEAAHDAGLINGYGDNTFLPENRIKRVETARILSRALSLEDYSGQAFSDVSLTYWGYAYIMMIRNAGVIKGYPDGTFKPEQTMSRAEAARVLKGAFFN